MTQNHDAMLDTVSVGRDPARLIRARVILLAAGAAIAVPCTAADLWGGSIELTSDYLVRGISRSDGQAAVQLDLHYANASGFIAGAFASTVRVDPASGSTVEVAGFVGYAWTPGNEWRSRLLATHYAYPGTENASRYDYDEVDFATTYGDWIEFSVQYSPDSPRYLEYGAFQRVAAESGEVDVHQPLIGRLSGSLGAGYYHLASAAGYAYGSAGLLYDIARMSFAVSFVDAGNAAKSLFYNTAAGGRWTGTVIWRF